MRSSTSGTTTITVICSSLPQYFSELGTSTSGEVELPSSTPEIPVPSGSGLFYSPFREFIHLVQRISDIAAIQSFLPLCYQVLQHQAHGSAGIWFPKLNYRCILCSWFDSYR